MSVLRTDEPAEGVLRLRLDRPAKRNAVDRELAEALVEAFGSSDAKVVILGSSGPEAFCAGLDLSLEPAERVGVSDLLYETYERMLASPAPIVASIPGRRSAAARSSRSQPTSGSPARQAQIRFAGPGHGLAVGAWGLGSLVGRGRAMDLCLSMRPVSADEAAAMGLVDRVAHDPDAEALELATRLVRLDAPAVARVKRLVTSDGLLEALRRERRDNVRRGRGRSRRARSPLPSATMPDPLAGGTIARASPAAWRTHLGGEVDDELLAALGAGSLAAAFHETADARPDAPALDDRRRLGQPRRARRPGGSGRRVAAEHGIEQGDRMLLCAPNSLALVVAYLATLRVGATAVPLAPTLTGPELAGIAAIAEPRRCVRRRGPRARDAPNGRRGSMAGGGVGR